ncbi:amidohydrolase family protein [Zhongshania borealis]|uniref:Amidohydrolase family protein n=1 Tax=Zhongshania borealis TaxID=889488 RepID=A0ABP7X4D2_9GAMM
MIRIDAHQHFWQLTRGDYDWLTADLGVLYRDFLPDQLRPILSKAEISKTVLVQAAATLEESEFMLGLASNTDFIAGVVAWIDMEKPTAVSVLDRLGEHAAFRGVRPMIQDIADPQWMLKPELAPVFKALIERNLTFDALVKVEHLDALSTLLQRYPELKLVIDHGAKPAIATGSNDAWFTAIERLALETGACCKLSGLMTEAGDTPTYQTLLPYMTHLLNCFGAERLMWGSDWPVVNLAGSYGEWLTHSEVFVASLSDAEQSAIWGDTAAGFYSL